MSRALLVSLLVTGVPLGFAWAQTRGRPAPVDDAVGQQDGQAVQGDSEAPPAKRGDLPQLLSRALAWLRALPAEITDLHRWLDRHLGPVGAWGALGSPLLLLLALLGLRARRRVRPASPWARAARQSGNPRALAARQSGSPRGAGGAVQRGGRTAPRRKRATVLAAPIEEPKEVAAAAPPAPELSAEQRALMADDGAGGASLHETLCALGAHPVVVEALRHALSQCMDAAGWPVAVSDGGGAAFRSLRQRWIAEVAAQRLMGWVERHPLVAEFGYRVEVSGGAVGGDEQLSLGVVQPNGLAASLDGDQEQLLQRARGALQAVYASGGDPYSLLAVGRDTGLAALLGAGADAEDEAVGLQLAVLLHGTAAFGRAAASGLADAAHLRELQSALREHAQTVGGAVAAEGCAVHAIVQLRGAACEGMGTFLAAVAGAAYSASAVALRLSKLAGLMRPAAQREALAALGEKATGWLVEPGRGDATVFEDNLRRLLGEHLLVEVAPRARLVARTVAKVGPWNDQPRTRPELALLELHGAQVAHLRAQAGFAQRRALEIFRRLAYAGQDGESGDIAHRRLGYAVAGLGTELVRGASAEVLSLTREAIAALRAP